ncbi:MAG: plastocyanin/azurin family copper-binding protein [Dehalococcoidia bacterium]
MRLLIGFGAVSSVVVAALVMLTASAYVERESRAEAATTVNVSTVDYVFAPKVVTIQAGDTVRWLSNNLAGGDISNHTTTSDPGVVPAWHGELPPPGTEYSVTFNTPGTYTYHCEIHPVTMKGTVIVAAPTATRTPTRTATPSITPTATATPVPNANPSVTAQVDPIGGPDPLDVTLDWSASDADLEPLDANINWGDASSESTVVAPPYAPQSSLHTFTAPGSYQITLDVIDGAGVKATVKRTVLVGPDTDGDQVPDAYDNCPLVVNTGQQNADNRLDNGPNLHGDDLTVPNALSDSEGDACETDGDIDNDGLPDADESPLANCGAFDAIVAAHPSPGGGDVTNDDDGDGDPALPMGTDAGDNGPSWDTDNDGVMDGYECGQGANPRDRLSKPVALPDDHLDSDGDGLPNGWERRGWGTSISSTDSDGDGLGDCREAVDVDGNGAVNSTGDFQSVARAVFSSAGATQAFDIDRNGTLNSTGDVIEFARRVFQQQDCV